jgi:hypothetical protein
MHGARRSVRPGAKVERRREPAFSARRGAAPVRRKRRRPSRLKRWVARHPWLYRGLRFSVLAAIWGAIVLSAAVIYFIARVPDPIIAALDDRPPNVTVLAQDGTVLAERGLRRGHVRLEMLPPYLVQAVLATEDRRFYTHFGIDPLGLIRASFRNASAGGVVEGGSTITQQLAKNLFLRPERTITRKLEEVVYAVWLEHASRRKRSSSSISIAFISAAAHTGSRPRRAAISASRRASSPSPRRRCWPGCLRPLHATRRDGA